MLNEKKCKTCGGNLIQRATRQTVSQIKKNYYYTAYYYCLNCNKIYHNDKFKIINKTNSNLLFDTDIKRIEKIDFDAEIWTDGACVFNGRANARAAWAFVSNETEKSGLVPGAKQTNNVAEGLAVLHALEWAVKNHKRKIKIYSDSQVTINNINKSPNQIKQNREIFQKIHEVIYNNKLALELEKVPGHSGDINNARADKLANTLAASKQIL